MSIVSFTVVYPESKEGEYGSKEDPSPYVNLSNPKLDCIVDGDEVVIDKTLISVIVNYPLRDRFFLPLRTSNAKGFTRRELAKGISELYKWIYNVETNTSDVPEGRHSVYKLNRNRTDGYFGIWGHDIGDLDLHTVTYDASLDAYMLGIDS